MTDIKDFQREGMLAGIIAERDEIILNQAHRIAQLEEENKKSNETITALQAEIEKFQEQLKV